MRFFIFFVSVLLGLPTWAKEAPEAPAKMYLFTSLACPHCAQFHREILPEIQKKYLNMHKGQLVIVNMLMNKANLMGAMLLKCAPQGKVKTIEDVLYENQKNWAWDEDRAHTYLAEVAKKNGISASEFESCLANKNLESDIIREQEQMARLYNIKRMPTLLVRQGEKTSSWEGADKELVISELSSFFK